MKRVIITPMKKTNRIAISVFRMMAYLISQIVDCGDALSMSVNLNIKIMLHTIECS